jgi:hypothetical protein
MPKRDVKDTEISLKEKHKAETVTVKGTITQDQRIVLQKLVGVIGSNEQDVVGKILTLWLYNEGFLKVKKLNPVKQKI